MAGPFPLEVPRAMPNSETMDRKKAA